MAVIHWKRGISGDFNDPVDWRGKVEPGSADDARIDAGANGPITVSVSADASVYSLQIGRGVTLDILNGNFTDASGTGGANNAGTIDIGAGASFTLAGVFRNRGGMIVLDAARTPTGLIIAQAGAVINGGLVAMDASSASIVRGVYGGTSAPTLTNASTIAGTGIIDNLAITNTGLIDAEGVFPLSLLPGNLYEAGGAMITNPGTLEAGNAESTGVLALYSMTIANKGIIEADGAGSIVNLVDATIRGGTLSSAGGGVIATKIGHNTLDGRASMVTNLATIEVAGSELGLQGAIANIGGITLGTPTSGSAMDILADTTLTGGGLITLGGITENDVYSATGATLTNVDNTFVGAGYFDRAGPANLNLVNQTGGVIDANGTSSNPYQDIFDLGATTTIINAGVMESTNLGQLDIVSPVDNTGTIKAVGGLIRIIGAITGAGAVVVDGGTLDFALASNHDVSFKGGVGVLTLEQSQAYGGTVTGFSSAGGETFRLTDIRYLNAGQASFSGTKAGGTLTVTDGNVTAHISLGGNYLTTNFTTVRDQFGKVIVEASTTQAPIQRFAAAMAGIAADDPGGSTRWTEAAIVHDQPLTRPRVSIA